MIRTGEIVRAGLHDHLDCYGGVRPPEPYVRDVSLLTPKIQVAAPIIPGSSIMKLHMIDQTRKAGDRYGLIVVIAAEINTRQGHLEALPAEQAKDSRMDQFVQLLPKFDEGKISALDAAKEMYEKFGAIPIIVHPHPGIGRIFVHGIPSKYIEELVLELREANVWVPIGIERNSSQTDKFLFPFQRRRQAQIDQLIKELKVFRVGETASGDEHDNTLGWAHVEFETKYDIADTDSFLTSFGEALVSDDPRFATRAVVNRTIQSYGEWWEALKQMVFVHGIPRIERMLKVCGIPQPAIRELDLSGRYTKRNGQLTAERIAWREEIQEEVRRKTAQQPGLIKELSFADIYHQRVPPTVKLQPYHLV